MEGKTHLIEARNQRQEPIERFLSFKLCYSNSAVGMVGGRAFPSAKKNNTN